MPEDMKIPNSSEIDQALREFEAQSQPLGQTTQKAPEAPRVSDTFKTETTGISFETDSLKSINNANEIVVPRMVRIVMKLSGGAIKEQKQAEYILLGFAVVIFAVSLYLFFGDNLKKSANDGRSLQEILQSQPVR